MSLEFPYAGETYSLLCAVVWAFAVILFRKSGEHVPPLALNVFKNVLALALVVATMLVLGTRFFPAEARAADWLALLASGALGLGIADALVLASLNRIGASRFAIVDCSYTPCLFFCSWVALDEPLTPIALVAGALVVGAVLVGTLDPNGRDGGGTRAAVGVGAALGLVAMLVVAIGVVVAKPALKNVDPWWAIGVRLVGGALTSTVVAVVAPDRGAILEAFRPSRSWRVTVPATFVGTYVSMVLWILGIKFTAVTTAGILNQTSTIFTIILAWALLGERLTRRRLVAVGLGFVGAVLVSIEPLILRLVGHAPR